MAFSRQKAEERITDLGLSVSKHILKLLRFKDELNYDKHVHDTDVWLYDIAMITLKGNRKPSVPDLFKWIFIDNISKTSLKQFNNLYSSLPHLDQSTDQDVIDKTFDIGNKLCNDIVSKKFISIRDYL